MIRKSLIVLFTAICLNLGAFMPARAMDEPRQIIIPRLGIDLPVYKTDIVFDTWEVRLDGASFGEGSPFPGTNGNTIIFSHALPNLFGNLPSIKPQDYVHLFTDTDWFVYQVETVKTVDPTQTDVLNSRGKPELTLYTCVGPAYEQRFVVTAKLQSTSSFVSH